MWYLDGKADLSDQIKALQSSIDVLTLEMAELHRMMQSNPLDVARAVLNTPVDDART